jgi:hypothetical protein
LATKMSATPEGASLPRYTQLTSTASRRKPATA